MAFSLSRLLVMTVLALQTLLVPVLAATTSGPAQCVSFDANWNLLAFNYNGKDYNAGTQEAFASSAAATDITAPNRPPFDVSSSAPLCFLSKFTNSIYFLNADASDRSCVYIYDATAKSWSKQTTTGAPSSYDPSTFGAILDHDTNVFYALSGGEMYGLDMALLKAATSSPIPWRDIQKPELSPAGSSGASAYQPVMALAQNHIHFLGVPGVEAGSARVFVIHYSYLQPEIQPYGNFPNAHGKTASFFKDIGVQTQFAYIPEDGSATYVVDVIANNTRTLAAPKTIDPFASYVASPSALVQLSSTGGVVSWIGYDQASGKGTSWQSLSSLPSIITTASGGSPAASNSNSTSVGSGSGASPAGSVKGSSSSNSTSTTGSSSSGASTVQGHWGSVVGLVAGSALGLAGMFF